MARLIKKYKNRRLYDTEKSQYITIEDLHQYVVDEIKFHVEDSNNGKDLTNSTLLQILAEIETETSQFLSPEILCHLIKLSHHPLSKILRSMVEEMVKNLEKQISTNHYFSDYQHIQETWEKQLKQLIGNWQTIFRK
jgi:polyhydroxyalkanoate synthesis repressor PhaR